MLYFVIIICLCWKSVFTTDNDRNSRLRSLRSYNRMLRNHSNEMGDYKSETSQRQRTVSSRRELRENKKSENLLQKSQLVQRESEMDDNEPDISNKPLSQKEFLHYFGLIPKLVTEDKGKCYDEKCIEKKIREEEMGEEEMGEEEIREEEIREKEIGEMEIGEMEIGEMEIHEKETCEEEIGEMEIREKETCEEEIGEDEIREEEMRKEEINEEEIREEEINEEEINEKEIHEEEIHEEEIHELIENVTFDQIPSHINKHNYNMKLTSESKDNDEIDNGYEDPSAKDSILNNSSSHSHAEDDIYKYTHSTYAEILYTEGYVVDERRSKTCIRFGTNTSRPDKDKSRMVTSKKEISGCSNDINDGVSSQRARCEEDSDTAKLYSPISNVNPTFDQQFYEVNRSNVNLINDQEVCEGGKEGIREGNINNSDNSSRSPPGILLDTLSLVDPVLSDEPTFAQSDIVLSPAYEQDESLSVVDYEKREIDNTRGINVILPIFTMCESLPVYLDEKDVSNSCVNEENVDKGIIEPNNGAIQSHTNTNTVERSVIIAHNRGLAEMLAFNVSATADLAFSRESVIKSKDAANISEVPACSGDCFAKHALKFSGGTTFNKTLERILGGEWQNNTSFICELKCGKKHIHSSRLTRENFQWIFSTYSAELWNMFISSCQVQKNPTRDLSIRDAILCEDGLVLVKHEAHLYSSVIFSDQLFPEESCFKKMPRTLSVLVNAESYENEYLETITESCYDFSNFNMPLSEESYKKYTLETKSLWKATKILTINSAERYDALVRYLTCDLAVSKDADGRTILNEHIAVQCSFCRFEYPASILMPSRDVFSRLLELNLASFFKQNIGIKFIFMPEILSLKLFLCTYGKINAYSTKFRDLLLLYSLSNLCAIFDHIHKNYTKSFRETSIFAFKHRFAPFIFFIRDLYFLNLLQGFAFQPFVQAQYVLLYHSDLLHSLKNLSCVIPETGKSFDPFLMIFSIFFQTTPIRECNVSKICDLSDFLEEAENYKLDMHLIITYFSKSDVLLKVLETVNLPNLMFYRNEIICMSYLKLDPVQRFYELNNLLAAFSNYTMAEYH